MAGSRRQTPDNGDVGGGVSIVQDEILVLNFARRCRRHRRFVVVVVVVKTFFKTGDRPDAAAERLPESRRREEKKRVTTLFGWCLQHFLARSLARIEKSVHSILQCTGISYNQSVGHSPVRRKAPWLSSSRTRR